MTVGSDYSDLWSTNMVESVSEMMMMMITLKNKKEEILIFSLFSVSIP